MPFFVNIRWILNAIRDVDDTDIPTKDINFKYILRQLKRQVNEKRWNGHEVYYDFSYEVMFALQKCF